jgi:hypothetical protein
MNRRTFLQSIPLTISLPAIFWKDTSRTTNVILDPNERICKKKFELASSLNLHEKPIDEVILEIARSFLGVEYAANTIEAPGEEQLIINLQSLDCVTFYENALVLARCIKKQTLTFDDFKKELQFVRYRGGVINGYPSRLHYTSDYFYDNVQKGVLRDVTQELGGISFHKKINFMTSHEDSYPRLKESPDYVQVLQKIEDEISSRLMFHIPKSKMKKAASKIHDGDILGITTSIEGLDCTHTGIAMWQQGTLHMIHAPVPGSTVQITGLTLWEYLAQIKKDSGIMVARPLEPKV